MHLIASDKDQKRIRRISQSGQYKRKYHRDISSDFVGDLVDGRKIIGGIVENISPDGFEIANLPQSFTAEKYLYRTVLSGGGKHYKMLAKPCWRKKKGKYFTDIGFKIIDAPWQWLELTMQK